MNDILVSSTGAGTKLRIKSLAVIAIPVINEFLRTKGIELVPESFNVFIDAIFLIIGLGAHAWGWFRALYLVPRGWK
jgi:hypothetical protein